MAVLRIHYLNKCWKARTAEEDEVEITEAKGKGKKKARGRGRGRGKGYLMEVKKVREPKSPSRMTSASDSGLHQRLGIKEKVFFCFSKN
jgi:hypothetical protein